jgi:high-affinity nickel-transport protein
MNSTLWVALALGLRHGTDPDHLAAIDGLTRIRPRATNGLVFALGHGTVVTLLAAGIGQVVAGRLAGVGPWMLLLLGAVNLWKTIRPSAAAAAPSRPIVAQPFLLGVILAAGFETASQLSALMLADRTNPWLLGAVFSMGMLLVDGVDGYLAASTIGLAASGKANARLASRSLGFVVVVFAFGLGGAELLEFDVGPAALPLGLALLFIVIMIRVWARGGWQPARQTGERGSRSSLWMLAPSDRHMSR